MKNRGILLSENFELFGNRDFVLGDVTMQNAALIIKMHQGELKEKPLIGVGIDNMLLGHESLLYRHKIRQQLELEGIKLSVLEINGQNITINASY